MYTVDFPDRCINPKSNYLVPAVGHFNCAIYLRILLLIRKTRIMSVNKLALLRYKVIDQCLQNHYRKWTLEDLIEAVSDALYEYEGIRDGVGKRTIQLDIQNMRSDKLGYNAPIVVTDRKFYSYADKQYSITNSPISGHDLNKLNEVLIFLRQFSGFGHFRELAEMTARLEDNIYRRKHNGQSFIDLEKNELLKGLEYIQPIHEAVLNRQTLLVTYQSFKARQPADVIFYPYLLKEYRNRWFVLGERKKESGLINFALDRIEGLSTLPGEPYRESPVPDIHHYYKDVIGVTKSQGQRPVKVTLEINAQHAPYIRTKPMHPSQEILDSGPDRMVFTIEVVLNFELEREILGFGENLRVLGPRILVKRIGERLRRAGEGYGRG